MSDLATLLGRVSQVVAAADLSDPVRAKQNLQDSFTEGDLHELTQTLLSAHATGTLTPRDAGAGVRFGRAAKPGQLPGGCSVDVVDIEGSGAAHVHPKGEVSWCVPLSGDPRFEGVAAGWAVLAAGSQHVPTVTGGRMLIAYWLPEGSVTWV